MSRRTLAAAILLTTLVAPEVVGQSWERVRQLGSPAHEEGHAMVADAEGAVYLAGTFTGALALGDTTYVNQTEQDVFIVKLDASGEVAWSQAMSARKQITPAGIALDAQGNVYVVGSFQTPVEIGGVALESSGYVDAFVVKLSPEGSVMWARALGGEGVQTSTSIALDASGAVFLGGDFIGTASLGGVELSASDQAESGFFVATLTPAGAVQQAVGFSGADGSGSARIHSVTPEASGGAYIAGTFYGSVALGDVSLDAPEGARDGFVARLDAGGSVLWAQQIGGPDAISIYDADVSSSGGLYVSGHSVSTAEIGATTLSGGPDGFIARFSPEGTVVWARRLGRSSTAVARQIVADEDEGLYLAGDFYGAADFGTPSQPLASVDRGDVFVARLSAAGETEWVYGAGGSGQDSAESLVLRADGRVTIAGTFAESLSFGGTRLASAGRGDAFVATIDALAVASEVPPEASGGVSLSAPRPNPTGARTEITLTVREAQQTRVEVVDALGRRVQVLFEGPLVGSRTFRVETGSLPAGRYVVRARGEMGETSRALAVLR